MAFLGVQRRWLFGGLPLKTHMEPKLVQGPFFQFPAESLWGHTAYGWIIPPSEGIHFLPLRSICMFSERVGTHKISYTCFFGCVSLRIAPSKSQFCGVVVLLWWSRSLCPRRDLIGRCCDIASESIDGSESIDVIALDLKEKNTKRNCCQCQILSLHSTSFTSWTRMEWMNSRASRKACVPRWRWEEVEWAARERPPFGRGKMFGTFSTHHGLANQGKDGIQNLFLLAHLTSCCQGKGAMKGAIFGCKKKSEDSRERWTRIPPRFWSTHLSLRWLTWCFLKSINHYHGCVQFGSPDVFHQQVEPCLKQINSSFNLQIQWCSPRIGRVPPRLFEQGAGCGSGINILPSLKLTACTWKWIVGILVSCWDDLLSGAILVSGSVTKEHTAVKLGGGIQRFRSFLPRSLGKWFNLTNMFESCGWDTNYR